MCSTYTYISNAMNQKVLTSFVNQICRVNKETENENKALKKSVESCIKERPVLNDSQCYECAENLPELKAVLRKTAS